jgi:hypothetical protein
MTARDSWPVTVRVVVALAIALMIGATVYGALVVDRRPVTVEQISSGTVPRGDLVTVSGRVLPDSVAQRDDGITFRIVDTEDPTGEGLLVLWRGDRRAPAGDLVSVCGLVVSDGVLVGE